MGHETSAEETRPTRGRDPECDLRGVSGGHPGWCAFRRPQSWTLWAYGDALESEPWWWSASTRGGTPPVGLRSDRELEQASKDRAAPCASRGQERRAYEDRGQKARCLLALSAGHGRRPADVGRGEGGRRRVGRSRHCASRSAARHERELSLIRDRDRPSGTAASDYDEKDGRQERDPPSCPHGFTVQRHWSLEEPCWRELSPLRGPSLVGSGFLRSRRCRNWTTAPSARTFQRGCRG